MKKKFISEKLFIHGWKGLEAHTGFHPRTLQRWHLERARIPFLKTHPHSKNSRWVITPDRVYIWLKMIGIHGERLLSK